ncbi:MAG: 2,3-bisphosphoglycerate-dependent phosphoglycerate mutase [Candidatus Pacebacteria bacterium]|nr:2,3-bisphosphoglycerate-dependent phosphoglycerate mutase [Candidatus Paceibacterota bacterium]
MRLAARLGYRQVVLVRHGESVWNKSNRFTGWQDVPLSETGIQESVDAGRRIARSNIRIDAAFTSLLKRTICCFNSIADVLDIHHIPVVKSYRLNERHYGALEGLNKAEMIERYGRAQVRQWTRGYDSRPPARQSEGEYERKMGRRLSPGPYPSTEVPICTELHSR